MPKHIPQRTCIACRTVQSKRELLRIVRTPEGQVQADPTGKKNGRGTYLHKTRECFENILQAPGKLQHALNMQTPVSPEDLQTLAELAKTFPAQTLSGNEMKGHITEPRRARETTQQKSQVAKN